MNRSCAIETRRLDQGTRAILVGAIDEHCSLAALEALDPPLVLDLGGVTFINSTGLRSWIRFVRAVGGRGPVTIERCSEGMVMQLNMVADTLRGIEVVSFFAPYVCESCGREESQLLEVRRDFPQRRRSALPAFACPACRQPMIFAERPERYLLFLD